MPQVFVQPNLVQGYMVGSTDILEFLGSGLFLMDLFLRTFRFSKPFACFISVLPVSQFCTSRSYENIKLQDIKALTMLFKLALELSPKSETCSTM